MRGRGRRGHPRAGLWSFIIGQLYNQPGDPEGAARHRGKSRYTDQLHFAPNLPPESRYGLHNTWYFRNALDINTTNVWDESSSGSGTSLTVQDEHHGWAKVTCGTADNNYYYYFAKNETAKLESGKGLWFRTHIKVADADQCDMFLGLCKKLASGDLFDNRVDAIGFYVSDGSANINCEAKKDGTATQETAQGTLADDTEVDLAIQVRSTGSVLFFIDDKYKCSIFTNLPDDEELAFAFGIRNGQASANSISIGITRLIQDE